MHALAAFLFSLPLAALAGQHVASPHRRRHNNIDARNLTVARRGVSYTLEDDFSGDSFFEYVRAVPAMTAVALNIPAATLASTPRATPHMGS